jgi:hypothetical protein
MGGGFAYSQFVTKKGILLALLLVVVVLGVVFIPVYLAR